MTTLSANTPRDFELGDHNNLPVIAADIIYEGAAVGDNASGYMRPLVAGDPFRGFALDKADNSAGAAGAITVNLRARGRVKLAVGSLAITDVGKPVYASDDATFVLTESTNSHIGRVVRYVSSGVGIVEFDAAKGAGGAVAELGGTLTGTVDGDLADVADIALSTTNTYTDAAVNGAVNTAIASINLQLKELQVRVNSLLRMHG